MAGHSTRFLRKVDPNVIPTERHFHHNYHELPVEEEERLEKVFRELDVNNDGRIDVNDLVKALETKGIKPSHENIQVFHTLLNTFNCISLI